MTDITSSSNTINPLEKQQQNAHRHSRQIEAILHLSETAVSPKQLKHWLDINDGELDLALTTLKERLSQGALTLAQTASGYRLQVGAEFSSLIQSVFPERREHLSQALLETLSIIAYKQPVTRGDIEQVRGVTVSSAILRQLFDKGWIYECGHKDTLGRPALLATTNVFLDAFGLNSLDELPPLPELKSLGLDLIDNSQTITKAEKETEKEMSTTIN